METTFAIRFAVPFDVTFNTPKSKSIVSTSRWISLCTTTACHATIDFAGSVCDVFSRIRPTARFRTLNIAENGNTIGAALNDEDHKVFIRKTHVHVFFDASTVVSPALRRHLKNLAVPPGNDRSEGLPDLKSRQV